jgi:hypothetical protein
MKTIEQDPRWPKWLNDLMNRMVVDTDRITSKAVAYGPWGMYEAPRDMRIWFDEFNNGVFIRDPWTGKEIVADQYHSHIWNARYFKRWTYVDGNLRGLAWSWRPAGKDYKHTIILGTKINGRFALTFRFWHTDEESAAGTTGPNYGQATGDTFGPA